MLVVEDMDEDLNKVGDTLDESKVQQMAELLGVNIILKKESDDVKENIEMSAASVMSQGKPNAQVWEARGRPFKTDDITKAAINVGLPVDGKAVELFDAIKKTFDDMEGDRNNNIEQNSPGLLRLEEEMNKVRSRYNRK